MSKLIQRQRPLNLTFSDPTIQSIRCVHIGFRKMANVADSYSGNRHTKPGPNPRTKKITRRMRNLMFRDQQIPST